MQPTDKKPHILIYRIGLLGDTLVSLPALWALRRHYADARLTLLHEKHGDRPLVTAADVLAGSGLIDDFIAYRSGVSSFGMAAEMLVLLHRIKRSRFDRVIYLPPSSRRPEQVRRDEAFFRFAGIRDRVGFEPALPLEPTSSDTRHESDLLLDKLRRCGLAVCQASGLRCDANIQSFERDYITRWARANAPDRRPWVAFGPGSNMPAKRWPPERFARVGQALIAEYQAWPIVFGGPEDTRLGAWLIQQWHCGTNAAGQLPVRLALAAMERCRFFVGNDTGSMHMAASAGLPCVALFSNRDRIGKWHPLGSGHRVLRHPTDCCGCLSYTCARGPQSCMHALNVRQVIAACRELADRTIDRSAPIETQSGSDTTISTFPAPS